MVSMLGAGLIAPAFGLRALGRYPAQPVRLVVGFSAGSGPDLMARVIGKWLSSRLGQAFVVDDRPGAGSTLATQRVVRAPADGYTLLVATGSNAWNATLYRTLPYDFLRDITPVASIYQAPAVLVVNPLVPANSVAALVAYAKANPGKLNMASAGNGSTGHVFGELFRMMTKTDLVHVPYRDNPVPDLLNGRTQVYFSPISSASAFIKTGRLRALGVTSTTRWAALPQVPTVAEDVPGFEAAGWMGIVGPKNLPGDIVSTLERAIKAGLADPAVQRRIAAIGGAVLQEDSPDDFGRFMADYTAKWAKVIRFAGIHLD